MQILEKAQAENNSAELKYRLAVLNYGNNDKKSYDYFVKTQEINPAIINYDLYYNLILKLIDKAKQNNDKQEAKLYKQKAVFLKKYVNSNFISNDDFQLDNIQGSVVTTFWGAKKHIDVKFDITNNTKYPYKKLYALVELNVNGNQLSKEIAIGEMQKVIAPHVQVSGITCKIDISKVLGNKRDIKGEIYLYSNITKMPVRMAFIRLKGITQSKTKSNLFLIQVIYKLIISI